MESVCRISHEWRAQFQDLDPVITYRHLYSNNLVNNPLRVIALVDSDAFYAQAERNRLGLGDDIPVVVQQWESLIAVSYPARKFGISRFDKVSDAKRKCPEVVAVHVATYQEVMNVIVGSATEPGYWEERDSRTHKVSLDYYRRESAKVYSKYKEGVPRGQVEKASIDEVFLDLSAMVRELLLERYPYLREVPQSAPHGLNSALPSPPHIAWTARLGHLLPATGPDETPEEDSVTTWGDVALSIGAELIDDIRTRIREDVGYTTSGGIARNKALAKLVASYRKPNSQTILRNSAIPSYLCPLPFQKIRFLGGKLGETVAEEYQATTVGDLLSITTDDMQRKLGDESVWLYDMIRGIDKSEVKEKSALVKSMLASKNLQKPITQVQDGAHWIRVLAAELHLRLKEARETFPGLWPKSIVLHARIGYNTTKSKQNAFPFVRDVRIDDVAQAGNHLWNMLVGGPSTTALRVTNLQLSFTGLEFETGQQSIEGFFSAHSSTSAPSLGPALEDRKRKRDTNDALDVTAADEGKISGNSHLMISFACTRCGQQIESALQEEQDTEAATARLQLEHEDFHTAQDLYRSESKKIYFSSQRDLRPDAESISKRVKSSTARSGGIGQYFRPPAKS